MIARIGCGSFRVKRLGDRNSEPKPIDASSFTDEVLVHSGAGYSHEGKSVMRFAAPKEGPRINA